MATAQKKIPIKQRIKAKVSEKPSNWSQGAEERSAKRSALQHARRVSLLVLRELEKQKLSQTALAEKMGVSRQQVTKIVKGQENFTFETIAKLEEALGVSILMVDLGQRYTAPEAVLTFPVGNGWAFENAREPVMNGSAVLRKGYIPDVELSTIPVGMLQEIGLVRNIPIPLSPSGPALVYRVDDLTRSNWQSRIGELFDKLKQHGPITNFVVVGSAVPSAADWPDPM